MIRFVGATVNPDHEVGAIQVSVRACAVSLALSGLIVVGALPWHPSIFERPIDQVVHGFGAWTLLHVLAVVVVVLALIGAAGLVAVHDGHMGRLGQAGLVVTLVGVVGTAALTATEAIVFPVLADRAPTLLAIDGPLVRSPLFIATGVLALGWPLGLAILGLAAAKSRVFGRAPGIVLAVSGPLLVGLEGPFVPIAGVLSGVLFGIAQVWWGWLLWRSATGPEPIFA
jgi:hypothetical protein